MSAADSFTPEQRVWLGHDERRWQRARAIAARHPGVGVGGVYFGMRPPRLGSEAEDESH